MAWSEAVRRWIRFEVSDFWFCQSILLVQILPQIKCTATHFLWPIKPMHATLGFIAPVRTAAMHRYSVACYIVIRGSVNREAVTPSCPRTWRRHVRDMSADMTAAMTPRTCMHRARPRRHCRRHFTINRIIATSLEANSTTRHDQFSVGFSVFCNGGQTKCGLCKTNKFSQSGKHFMGCYCRWV